MAKLWEIAPQKHDDLIKQLLLNRGLIEDVEIERFFNPKIEDYQRELEIPGTKKAKQRIVQAIENQELVVVFGDYDADGVCGTAIFYNGLTLAGAKVYPYIPHREKEGYGLSKEGLDFAKEKGAKLVITVDNGIVAFEAANYAKSIGLDLIITDHHVAVEEKPECLALVHSTTMCGAAVGWCLVRAVVENPQVEELLDLVAIATICDLTPLVGVNRALVTRGLEFLNRTDRVGLKALFSEAKLKIGEIDAYQVGHVIGPRINAIGRLEHALDSVRLLCTKDVDKAFRLAKLLCEVNDQKKRLTIDAISQAKEVILGQQVDGKLTKKILLLHSSEWVPGIIGLIAGRIAEEYAVPTIALSKGELYSKGSARSVAGVNIVELFRKHSDLLLDVGGHPQAAGFTIETSKIDIFQQRLEESMEQAVLDQTVKLSIEATVKASKLNKKVAGELARFEPCGIANPKPILASFNVRVSNLATVGTGQHLKFKADGIEAIAFSFGHLKSLLKEGQMVNLAYFLEINKFNGNEVLQLKVVDIQLA